MNKLEEQLTGKAMLRRYLILEKEAENYKGLQPMLGLIGMFIRYLYYPGRMGLLQYIQDLKELEEENERS